MSSTKKPRNLPSNPKTSGGRRPGRPTIGNDELLDKALDLFLEQGYERTSVDGIAAAAGIAKRTLYLRYQDKDALFRAALQRAIEDWIVPIEQLRAVECDDLEKTLLEMGRIMLDNVMNPKGLRLIKIINSESARAPEIGAYTFQHGVERAAYLADLFRRRIGHTVTGLDNWHDAAVAFIYLVVSGPPAVTAWGMHLDDETLKRHTSHSVRLFLNGILPRDETVPQRNGTSALSVDQLPATDNQQNVSTETTNLIELQNENRRLRKLLLKSMLEVESLKERQENR